MRVDINHRTVDFSTYRAARVRSLFNVAEGKAGFQLAADLPIDDGDWQLGMVIGPSGSGKTSIGRALFDGAAFYESTDWPTDRPIVEAIAPGGDFDTVTGVLASVGLGDVPAWLRPYHVLSNGEKFRADMARVLAEQPERVVVDEFTSVVDRQIARFGALAFAKSWRRTTGKQAVLLSCHYDVLEWVQPDWTFDTASGKFARGYLRWGNPVIELEIRRGNWALYERLFERHHYLSLPRMIGAVNYYGLVDGEPVAHLAVASAKKGRVAEARACRLVVLPEWQGAGVGARFLRRVCDMQLDGDTNARLPGRNVTTIIHTSHPGLAASLRRGKGWRQVSAKMHGVNKANSRKTMAASVNGRTFGVSAGYGGHFRAVQGFRYGEAELRRRWVEDSKAVRL